jgi:hypothetical protein
MTSPRLLRIDRHLVEDRIGHMSFKTYRTSLGAARLTRHAGGAASGHRPPDSRHTLMLMVPDN